MKRPSYKQVYSVLIVILKIFLYVESKIYSEHAREHCVEGLFGHGIVGG
jgi:hypothetical protein